MADPEYGYLIEEYLYSTQLNNLEYLEGETDIVINYFIYGPSTMPSYITFYGVRTVEEFEYEMELMADIALLDTVLDVDFTRTYDPSSCQISFVQVDSLRSDIVGYASSESRYNSESIEIATILTGQAAFDYGTVIHELGHALGLSHPYDSGANPMFTTDDTIMSYNRGDEGWGSSFTDLDIAVLQTLWGTEEDTGYAITQSGTNTSDTIYGHDGNDFSDIISGNGGDDEIWGYKGADILDGGDNDDELHAGNGRDTISGGNGSDQCHGGFGLNLFESELDGSPDSIYIKSDQWLLNPLLGTAGNNPNGEKADIVTELDVEDRIIIEGVSKESLSFSNIEYSVDPNITLSAIGIYADSALEAVYIGSNLTIYEIESITTGQA